MRCSPAFPDKRFLINVKSNDLSEGEKLAAHLAKLAPEARARLMVYGGTPPTELVHEKLPDVAIGSKKSLQSCLLGYAALGWSGYVPAACRKGMMLVPLNVAPWLWGWPDKFMQRMHARRRRRVRARPLRRQLRHRAASTISEQLARAAEGLHAAASGPTASTASALPCAATPWRPDGRS